MYGNDPEVLFGAMGLPTFHAIGLFLQAAHPLAVGRSVVVFTPQYPDPPTIAHAQSVYGVSRAAGCNGIFAIPSFIEVPKFIRSLLLRILIKASMSRIGMVS